MAATINNNFGLSATSLQHTSAALQKSMARLSSGLRLGAERDKDEVRISTAGQEQAGVKTALREANDRATMVNVASGAYSSATNTLTEMRELVVKAAHTTMTDDERAGIQKRVDELAAQLDQTGRNATFNGRTLMDGSAKIDFKLSQSGNEFTSVQIGELSSGRLFSKTNSLVGDAALEIGFGRDAEGFARQGLDFTKGAVGKNDQLVIQGVAIGMTGGDAGTKAAAINSAMRANGLDVTASAETKVYATLNMNSIERLPGQAQWRQTDASAGKSDGAVTINGVSVALRGNDEVADVAAKINAAGIRDVTASVEGKQLVLTSSTGADIVLGNSGEGQAGFFAVGLSAGDSSQLASGQSAAVRGKFTLTAGADTSLTLGGTATKDAKGAKLATAVVGDAAAVAKLGLHQVDVSSAKAAQGAIDKIDDAIEKFTAAGEQLQRYNQGTTMTDLSSSLPAALNASSRIVDTDFASETTSMTRNQLLQNPVVSMAAQANVGHQVVFSLLR